MSTHDAGLVGLSRSDRKALQANIANFYIEANDGHQHALMVEMTARWFKVDKSYVIASLRNYNCLRHRPIVNMDPERVEILTQAKRDGWSIKETGEALGVSKERARQLINKFYYVEAENPGITHQFVIEKFGISRRILYRALYEYGIDRLRMNDLKKLEPIVKKLLMSNRCPRCDSPVPYKDKWCSTYCAAMHRYDNRLAGDGLIALAKRFKSKPAGDWMPLSAASRKFELTKAQIAYYAHYGVLRVKKNRKRLWRGKPTKLYSVGDLRELKKHLKKSRRPSSRKTRRGA